jgi:hypothetical protein
MKEADTHVESFGDVPSDAGSTPAASNTPHSRSSYCRRRVQASTDELRSSLSARLPPPPPTFAHEGRLPSCISTRQRVLGAVVDGAWPGHRLSDRITDSLTSWERHSHHCRASSPPSTQRASTWCRWARPMSCARLERAPSTGERVRGPLPRRIRQDSTNSCTN